MPETSANMEIAQRMDEDSREAKREPGRRREEILEIGQAILLALVAIATAWSGYEAARWDSRSAQLYGQSSHLRTTASQLQTMAGQLQLYDTMTFNFWLEATVRGDTTLASLYEARFRPEYRVAFDAWKQLNPLSNPGSPPGPSFMPQYHLSAADRAASADAQASAAFDAAAVARDSGDTYVRVTVFLAGVLFLIAVSQRFRILPVRLGLLGVAALFFCFSLYAVATSPHA